ncbi:MAG: MarR family transcriptional regulator [Flavobacteriales bacterium]|nr:MarR family transcriptional regulator [Flavobacteriales bacterium]
MTFEELVKSKEVDVRKRAVISIVYTQNILGDKLNEMLKPYDLSPEQFNVLRILRGNKGKPANMSTIQERMIAKTSNTTRLIDKLLAKDLVSRQVCPNNRRKMEVNITDKGLSLLLEIDPKMNKHEESSTRNLTQKELEQLIDLLDKIRN